jgi:hypothetical protein
VALDISELELDDGNRREFERHGVRELEIIQVLRGPFRVFRNRKHRAAEYLMVGPTRGGRLLTVPIKATPVEGRWRPITAWDSSPGERTRYEQ